MPHDRISYARSGDVSIAYQVVGDGPRDIVLVPGWVSNLEAAWEDPDLARAQERLASFSRLILFDKRGTGLSDRVPASDLPSLETRMDDVRAVMDVVGSERAALFGSSEGGSMAVLFAATYPERTTALMGFGMFASRRWSPEYPWAPTTEQREAWLSTIAERLGRRRRPRRHRPESGGRRAVSRMVRELHPAQREPGVRGGPRPHEHRHRRPGSAPDDPRSDARDAPGRRPRRQRRGSPLHRVADSRGEARRVPGRGSRLLDTGRGRRRGRDRGVPDRRAPRSRARPGAGDGAVHRHRGLDRPRGEDGRPAVDGRARGAPDDGALVPGALPRPRGGHGGRRILRHVRWTGPSHPLRAGRARRRA